MSQSLAKIIIHTVFGTKHRMPCLSEAVYCQLWRYMAGTLDALDCRAIQIGGTADHVHVLCRLSKNTAVCKLIEEVKKESSKWLKRQEPNLQEFYWQAGYGIFWIGQSGVSSAQRYILRQDEHHRKISFQDEYRRLLAKYEIAYDERYVCD